MARCDEKMPAEELLSSDEIIEFVERHAGTVKTVEEFHDVTIPSGLSPDLAFDLVEFVRRTGAGMLVCGQHRGCDHAGSWYAMTPSFSSRLAHLEYRVRFKGSLRKDFSHYVAAWKLYPAQLEELACALFLDGVHLSFDNLRSLCLGERSPRNETELLATNAFTLLSNLDSWSELPITEDLLMRLHGELSKGIEGMTCRPAKRPSPPIKSDCDYFCIKFITDAMQGITPVSSPPLMFILFCSDSMWRMPIFPSWSNTMELIVRGLLLSSVGMSLLRYIPLSLPFWRWQNGILDATFNGVPYEKAMFRTRFGGDMTGLFTQLLGFIEQGLDELAEWVSKCREIDESCRTAICVSPILNHRQQRLMLDFIDRPTLSLDAAEYEKQFDVVPSTAYADLKKLTNLGYLASRTEGRSRVYSVAPHLATRLLKGEGNAVMDDLAITVEKGRKGM